MSNISVFGFEAAQWFHAYNWRETCMLYTSHIYHWANAMFGLGVSIKKCEIQASWWFSSNLPICMPHCKRCTAAIGQRTLFNYKFVLFLLYSYVRACGFEWSYFIFQSRKRHAKIGGILLFMVYGSRNSSESNATLQFAQMFRSYVNYSTNFVDLNDKTINRWAQSAYSWSDQLYKLIKYHPCNFALFSRDLDFFGAFWLNFRNVLHFDSLFSHL